MTQSLKTNKSMGDVTLNGSGKLYLSRTPRSVGKFIEDQITFLKTKEKNIRAKQEEDERSNSELHLSI